MLAVSHSFVGANVLCVRPMGRSDSAFERILLLDQILLGSVGNGHEASVNSHSRLI